MIDWSDNESSRVESSRVGRDRSSRRPPTPTSLSQQRWCSLCVATAVTGTPDEVLLPTAISPLASLDSIACPVSVHGGSACLPLPPPKDGWEDPWRGTWRQPDPVHARSIDTHTPSQSIPPHSHVQDDTIATIVESGCDLSHPVDVTSLFQQIFLKRSMPLPPFPHYSHAHSLPLSRLPHS